MRKFGVEIVEREGNEVAELSVIPTLGQTIHDRGLEKEYRGWGDERDFSATNMWRGPIFSNINQPSRIWKR